MTPLCVFFFAVIDAKSNISLRGNDDKRGVSGDLSCCVLMRLMRHVEITIIKDGRCLRVTLGKGKQNDQFPKSSRLFLS